MQKSYPDKYRPKTMDEIIGNEDSFDMVRSWVENNQIPHAILFFGASGVGKTTVSRIFKKVLDAKVIEFNSSHFSGIDDVRKFNNTVGGAKPLDGKKRLFIFDEMHKLSKDAQNGLLKVVEEPPEWVTIIFTTTEVDKIVKPLLSRLAKVEVQPADEISIYKNLVNVTRKEKKKVPKEILKYIARSALGNIRTSLVALESIVDLPADKMKANVIKIVNEEQAANKLFQAILRGSSFYDLRKIKVNQPEETIRKSGLGYFASVMYRDRNTGTIHNAYKAMDAFRQPFYDKGCLIRALYEIANSE